jgi:hypothetical protein
MKPKQEYFAIIKKIEKGKFIKNIISNDDIINIILQTKIINSNSKIINTKQGGQIITKNNDKYNVKILLDNVDYNSESTEINIYIKKKNSNKYLYTIKMNFMDFIIPVTNNQKNINHCITVTIEYQNCFNCFCSKGKCKKRIENFIKNFE